MSKRLIVVAFCILFLPMLASISPNKNSDASGPAVVAFAGHSTAGGEACTCGCPNCICDSGETPNCTHTNGAAGQPNDKLPGRRTPSSQADYGTGALMVALALMVWLRLRA
jgi:hypothetical protein